MADGSNPTVVSKNDDSNAQTNAFFVSLSDGTDLALIDGSGNLQVLVNNGAGAAAVNVQDGGNSITVDGTVAISSIVPGTTATNLGKAEDAAHTTGDVGVMSLAVRNDAGTALATTDGDYIPLSTDSSGNLRISGTVTASNPSVLVDDSAFGIATSSVTAMGALADETGTDSVDEGDIGAPRMTLDRKLLTRVVGATDANRLDIDASGRAKVSLDAVTVTTVPVSKNSSANSETNPIWVQATESIVSGTEVHNYNTASSIASGATSNHDYTVTGATFFLEQIIVAASGACKLELQTGPVASLATKAVGFIPSVGGFATYTFNPPIEVPVASTGTVRIIRTNRNGILNPQDLYSTIIGKDI